MPVDLYGLVHKGQRYRLFQFALSLSCKDLNEASERRFATDEVRSLVALLTDHAHTEERYIHPLFTRGDDATPAEKAALTRLENEHLSLEAHLQTLSVLTTDGRFDELYSAVMRFIGSYLLHLDAEEAAQRALLWPRYGDHELLAVMARFHAERDVALAREDLKLLLPAMNKPELVAFVRNKRARTTESDSSEFTHLAVQALGHARFAELCAALEAQS